MKLPLRSSRRGSILVLSLLVVTIGAMVGTSIIYYSGADRRAADMGVRRVQARAMAWSGVQAVMAELAKQRDALIAGDAPSLTELWMAPSSVQGAALSPAASGARWGFRVLPVAGKTAWSEAGKLDVNNVPAEVLAKLPRVGEELAGRIVAAREKRRFTSVVELLSVPGISYDLLYGSSAATGALAEPDRAATSPAAGDANPSAPLNRYLTVYSFDPEVQVGFGAKASEAAGKQRININAPWSDDLGSAIEDRFDKGIADGVKGLMERGEKFEKPSSIVKKLRELKVPPPDWVEVIDAFTTNPDQYRLGAADLLTAPAAVLECIPGLSAETAEEIVARREKLDSTRRSTVAWPVLEDIVKPEDFEKAVDYLTSRSLQWRVVVEGGIFPDTSDGITADHGPDWEPTAGTSATDADTRTPPLRDRVVLEAVIDVSSLRARVAYLRDVTFLPTARSLAATADKDRELNGDQTANIGEETTEGNKTESLPDGFHTELNMQGLDSAPTSKEDGGLDLPHLGSNADSPDGAGGNEKAGGGAAAEEQEAPPAGAGGRDRRLGRWTTGSGGSR
jgi:DNA uptake protein ComE-like DNA-binding protein